MKICIVGYGKMGKIVETAAKRRGHEIVAIIDKKWTPSGKAALASADVCIDFSAPDAALTNTRIIAGAGVNLVMGTTGWLEHLDEVKAIVEHTNIGFLYSPNFSIGVALFLKIVEEAASLIAPFDQYDVSGIEIHHNQKLDAPSGTAKAIADTLNKKIPSKKNEIAFSSVRVGSVPGTHTVLIDSPVDTITLTHTARNREGFADGAVTAAEWLQHKKGFFTLNDLLSSL